MTKQIKYILFGLMSLLLFNACSKALDRAPDGKLSMDELFEDDAKVRAFLNTCYNNMPAKGALYWFFSRGPVEWSDEAWDADAEAETGLMSGRMYAGNASPANHPIVNTNADNGNGEYWARYWNAIYNCSVFIQNIDEAAVIDEKNRPRWKAEAHLLRAYYYSELLKWYGAVLPIIREPSHFTDDFSGLQKASFYDVAKFIEEDCNVALATAELPWRITSDAEAGRLNKAMAEALKSKMLLFAASPLFNQGQDYWQEAYEVNKKSLENLRAQGFALYSKVNFPQTWQSASSFFGPDNDEKAALYNEYFTNNMAYSNNPIDKETLYQSRQAQGNIWNIDGIGAQDGYKSGTNPSQEIVDAYETIDGQPILDLNQPYLDEKHLQPNYNPDNTLYNPRDPYANRDPRFYASIYYNGSKRKALWGFAETAESPENYPAASGNRTRIIATYIGEPKTGLHASTRSATRTGYYQRKFLHPTSGNDNTVAGAYWKLFRLGEVILNFAEAAAEAGHLDEAKDAVDEIRARVGMPPIPAGLSQQDLITRVRQERRIELAFEENRYFDVRRWSEPTGNLSKTDKWITAMAITRNANGSYTYNRQTVRSLERLCYTNKFLLLPMPLAEANRLRSITGFDWQNPGW